MNIYILKPISTEAGSKWHPWYDKTFGMIVSADSEGEARYLANENSCGEDGGWGVDDNYGVWLNEKQTTCKILEANESEVIMKDFRGA